MQDTITKTIDSALVKIKKDVEQAMRNDMKVLEQELIRIFGLKEDVRTENGRQIGGDSNVTMEKVINVAKAVNAQVTWHDLSIAHRLPRRQEGTERPVIVRFSRRIGKVNLLKKKKQL